MAESPHPQAVVVGVDGSSAAIRAAVWAIDEAVSRDIPLRLVHIIDAQHLVEHDPHRLRFASAEVAIHDAYTAVEATRKPAKIETERKRDDGRVGCRHVGHRRFPATPTRRARNG